MELSSFTIEKLVKQVRQEIHGGSHQEDTPDPVPQPVGPAQEADASPAIPEKGRQALLAAIGQFELRAFPLPAVSGSSALIRVRACSVSGPELSLYREDPQNHIPLVPGRAGIGIAVKTGAYPLKDIRGTVLKEGDAVAAVSLPEASSEGWFADHVLLTDKSPFLIVDQLNPELCLWLDASAQAWAAIRSLRCLHPMGFQCEAAVVGLGDTGILILAQLYAMGLRHILAADSNADRLMQAGAFGADKAIQVAESEPLPAALLERYDQVFYCSGNVPVDVGMALAKPGGGLSVLSGDSIIKNTLSKALTVQFPEAPNKEDYLSAYAFLQLAAQSGVPLSDLVAGRFPLNRIDEAFHAAGKALDRKIVVAPE